MKTTRLTAYLALSLSATPLPAAVPYPIADTGQIRCYDNRSEISPPAPEQPFFGQDGQYQGRQPAYKDNGDGTVSDPVTGLTWIQRPPSAKCPWADAPKVVAALNARKFGGHTDWRVPTTKELYSLINHDKGWPYIDTKFFVCELAPQVIDQVKNTQYWTCDRSVTPDGTPEAFGINFATGHIKAYALGMGSYVRCVRGDSGYGKNEFHDNGDGTITDRATGLMWSKEDSRNGLNWEEALAWAHSCNKANYLGHNDWRLPNVRTLQGIVDYARIMETGKPATVATAMDPVFSSTSITDEEGNPDCPYYWSSTSCYHGPTMPEYRFAWYVSFGRAKIAPASEGPGTNRTRSRRVAEAGATRYDAKAKAGQTAGPGSDGERIYNYARLVRGGDLTPRKDNPSPSPAVVQQPQIPIPATPAAAPAATTAAGRPPMPTSPMISALDLNGDGVIDADEIAKAAESLKKLDKNHDGKITADEYRPQRPGGTAGPPTGAGAGTEPPQRPGNNP